MSTEPPAGLNRQGGSPGRGRPRPATIWVIAGPNGGGKSSLVGELIRESGGAYFNPDELTRRILDRKPGLARAQANALAWQEGRRRLEQAIAAGSSFAFETTLGGSTISRLLHQAAERGMRVKIWFMGLDSADRHLARVRARVARGGHPIPEERVRARYDRSRLNLVQLIPKLAALRLYDNSFEADFGAGQRPRPRLLLDFDQGGIRNPEDLAATPDWAKPIVAAALKVRPLPTAALPAASPKAGKQRRSRRRR